MMKKKSKRKHKEKGAFSLLHGSRLQAGVHLGSIHAEEVKQAP